MDNLAAACGVLPDRHEIRDSTADMSTRNWKRLGRDGSWERRSSVRTEQVNRASSIGLVLFSVTALFSVLWGSTQPPLPDEGVGAHIFQLSVAALLPVTIIFLTTAYWR